MNLLEKYKPTKFNETLLEKEKLTELKRFVLEKKPVIISGPTGCGKTSLVYTFANELNFQVLEINSSESRNKNNLEAVLAPGIKEATLTGKGRIVLIDDIDALSGTKDRGAIQTVIKLIQETKWPIIITTIDPFSDKLASLRKKTGLIEIEPISTEKILQLLKTICKKEKILYHPKVLIELTNRSRGDIRAALTDLQSLTKEKKLESIESVGEREKTENILQALKTIFKKENIQGSIQSFNKTNINPDEAMLWLDENLPHEYSKKEDLWRAYESLSKADIFKNRIRRWQYWRFLVYQNFFMTAGISLAKSSPYLSYSGYKRSGRLLKLFWAKQKRMKKEVIAKKIAEQTHTSKKRVIQDTLPYIQLIYKTGREIKELNLTIEEVDWLRK